MRKIYIKENIFISKFSLMSFWQTEWLHNECIKNVFIHSNFENVIETWGDSRKPGTSVEITVVRLIFVDKGRRIEGFCLIWELFARKTADMTESSQLIYYYLYFQWKIKLWPSNTISSLSHLINFLGIWMWVE